jgi:phage-related protein
MTLQRCLPAWPNCATGVIAEPLSKALGHGLFELRHVGKLNTRVLWFFVKGRRIIAVHAIRNKGQAISTHDLRTALERMADWRKRMKS